MTRLIRFQLRKECCARAEAFPLSVRHGVTRRRNQCKGFDRWTPARQYLNCSEVVCNSNYHPQSIHASERAIVPGASIRSL
jgi:hypothetical protein